MGLGPMMSASPGWQALPASPEKSTSCEGKEPPPPARLARLFSPELVKEAQIVFAKRTQREISESEARTMLANLTGYIRLLAAAG